MGLITGIAKSRRQSPVIPALGRLRQENQKLKVFILDYLAKFEVSLRYVRQREKGGVGQGVRIICLIGVT